MPAAETTEAPPATPPQKFDIKAKTAAGVNYAGAFLLFCKGISIREIATEFDLEYGKLLTRARAEDWEMLAKKQNFLSIPSPKVSAIVMTGDELAEKEDKIAKNRSAALEVAQRVRANILNVFKAYEAENAFMRPDDILTLAKAAKLADDCSMLALGDETATKAETKQCGNNGPAIIINLPSSVASPRSTLRQAERAVEQVPQPTDAPALGREMIPDDPEPEPSADQLVEINVLSPASGAPEAVPAMNGRGYSINFDTLSSVANPANGTPDAAGPRRRPTPTPAPVEPQEE